LSALHLDTHVVLWLYEGALDRLAPALERLENQQVVVSPMVVLELQYLHEIGGSRVPAAAIIESLSETVGLSIAPSRWEQVVQVALSLSWTRDPFDRLIAAHALSMGATLITADERIRSHCPGAVWG